jgi:mRNA-degrading endonuclease RelE of RelBE toxin-antitoxin system
LVALEEGGQEAEVSPYRVYVMPAALGEISQLPGNVRQRAKRAISSLSENPQPANSAGLDLSEELPGFDPGRDIRRLRIDRWRIVNVVTGSEKTVDILAVRKRPPYDYGDLRSLLAYIK